MEDKLIEQEAKELLKTDLLNIIDAYHSENNISYYDAAINVPHILIDLYFNDFQKCIENYKIFIEENKNYWKKK